ncbi:MAG: hypothetical protein LBF22_11405 [Deltaproteobacteria bacterium]|jgi:hypothetical protein|nr:hypothetical protein [Deltaproteobacteria bacterium]
MTLPPPPITPDPPGEFSKTIREHQDPAYQGLYLANRAITGWIVSPDTPPKGTLEDLNTIYPLDLSLALTQRDALLDDIQALRRKGHRLKPRDQNKLALLEKELEVLEKRLVLHDQRCRGAFLELAKQKGLGWVDYLMSLQRILYFIEKTYENIHSLATILKDPGKSPKAILKNLWLSLRREITETIRLSYAIVPPSDLTGNRILGAAPVFENPPTTTHAKKLLNAADSVLKELKRARLVNLDALLLAEKYLLTSSGLAPKGSFVDSRVAEIVGPKLEDKAKSLNEDSSLSEQKWAPLPAGAPFPPGPITPSRLEKEYLLPKRSTMRVLVSISVGLALALLVLYLKTVFFPLDKEVNFYIFNGLGTRVNILMEEKDITLGPGERLIRPLGSAQSIELKAFASTGELIEEIVFTRELDPGYSLVYSVARAAPFIEWKARYSSSRLNAENLSENTAVEDRLLGNPNLIVTNADSILTIPPERVKIQGETKDLLSLNPLFGVHPSLMLNLLQGEDKFPLIEAHARWNDPADLFLPVWLRLLVIEDPEIGLKILEQRWNSRPSDIWTILELLFLYSPSQRADFCYTLKNTLNLEPNEVDKLYLEVRCLETPEERNLRTAELLEIFPENPFLNRDIGVVAFQLGDNQKAHFHLKKAFSLDPRVMLNYLDLLARLNHLFGDHKSVIISEIGPWSPEIRKLLAFSGPPDSTERKNTPEMAFRYLDDGMILEALNAAGEEFIKTLLPFAANSTGATQELRQRLLEYKPQDILNLNTAWTLWGFYLNLLNQPNREETELATLNKNIQIVQNYLIAKLDNPETTERALYLIREQIFSELNDLKRGLTPWYQGQLALASYLAYPETAPKEFKELGRGFLFMGERPFLR